MGGIALYLSIAVGALVVFFWALPFLAAIANVLGAISLILVVPLLILQLIFKRTRSFSGNSIILVSFMLGASSWLTATVWLNDLWGATAVIVGILMFGIGSVPLALLALLFHAKFSMFFTLVGQLVAVYVLRILGLWIESKSAQLTTDSAPKPPALTAEEWLLKGRQSYDLADLAKPQEWNPAYAATCFENGLRIAPENADLHLYLGMLYSDGEGVPQDYSEALKHYRAAAELGDASAQRSIGEMYEEGHGVKKNRHTAAAWYEEAANQGDSYAQSRLGFLYSKGLGVKQDLLKAFGWYLKAAHAGEADAQSALAQMYAEGLAVKPDLTHPS